MQWIIKNGRTYNIKRCDYRHRGRTKRRFILRECYRNGMPVPREDSPRVLFLASLD
ncbi:MAG: hypothetical protein GTN71_00250 [Anaerolineae bacterium]|nr:hypothetical protein [Anaerolineae bacterium]